MEFFRFDTPPLRTDPLNLTLVMQAQGLSNWYFFMQWNPTP